MEITPLLLIMIYFPAAAVLARYHSHRPRKTFIQAISIRSIYTGELWNSSLAEVAAVLFLRLEQERKWMETDRRRAIVSSFSL